MNARTRTHHSHYQNTPPYRVQEKDAHYANQLLWVQRISGGVLLSVIVLTLYITGGLLVAPYFASWIYFSWFPWTLFFLFVLLPLSLFALSTYKFRQLLVVVESSPDLSSVSNSSEEEEEEEVIQQHEGFPVNCYSETPPGEVPVIVVESTPPSSKNNHHPSPRSSSS